jgi:site-specific recombinase XerD
VGVRFRSLKQWFRWCVEEEELDTSPMARMSAPNVPDKPVKMLSNDELKLLMATCTGKDFDERRDQAIIRLFADTGMRLAELTTLDVDGIDWDHDVALIMGKGSRPRSAPFGNETGQALSRYLHVRGRHKHSNSPALWLGARGPLSDSGVRTAVKRRAKQAGIEKLYPHMLRHGFAHQWLANGGTEGDLMRVAGWKSREMLQRYGAAGADVRAVDAHRRMALGDRF